MSSNHQGKRRDSGRGNTRIHTVEKISVNYEGRTEEVADRLPDVSPRGMFINTSQRFPQGAVLNLTFRMAMSGGSSDALRSALLPGWHRSWRGIYRHLARGDTGHRARGGALRQQARPAQKEEGAPVPIAK